MFDLSVDFSTVQSPVSPKWNFLRLSVHGIFLRLNFVWPNDFDLWHFSITFTSHKRHKHQFKLYVTCRFCQLSVPPCGVGAPLFPLVHLLPHILPFLLFPFFHWLYLFSSFVHPFPFYQNSPTPFPGGGRRKRPHLVFFKFVLSVFLG